tara:strand:- start:3228 stop:3668 length:441 start_codon:yes stop_codon:yes gene_type:complete
MNSIYIFSKKLFLSLSFILFCISIYLPIIRIKTIYILSKDISIIQSVIILFEEGLYFLSILILVFSTVFPILKYIYLFNFTFKIKYFKKSLLMEIISNWSMTDVFVISLIISIYKVSLLSDIEVYNTFYLFIFSILSQLVFFKMVK